ncbi:MAG: peptidoglycan editing factor PgeF [Burkholderiales bacterium]|nr:peptidoglycan editing factor PgeF [Burkholderiales bacterium]MDE2396510.1 peptidoglycan editing factor PgeF [Burkholderiales bacterium]MDE2453447.1 peptidoglycan editing factor PgeF [Burkholderiales bacterium]
MGSRAGGVSAPPWDSLNLGAMVGDDVQAVAENRRRFAASCGAQPVWLHQVHGRRVVRLGHDRDLQADAAWTDEPGLACTVLVADCLPVLLARRDGRAVAAAHAGWRGLAGGVAEAALEALCEGSGCGPDEVVAWLGPCIGPRRFEVGADVVAAFPESPALFVARPRPDGSPRWLADLAGLARARLERAGVAAVSGGSWCTVEDRERFFSYRRDGVSGRMAAAVWIPGA